MVVGLVVLGQLEVACVGLFCGGLVCGRGMSVFVKTVCHRI